MSAYGYRNFQFATAAGNVPLRVIGSNARRLTLLISGDVSTFLRVGNSANGGTVQAFITVSGIAAPPLTYRDFGTLMQYEIWVSSTAAITNLFVTEVYLLSR